MGCSPHRVGNALLTHPGIREAAVAGQILPDGIRTLVAHLVAKERALSAAQVGQHLRARLPAAAVPFAVEVVDRPSRTSSGKTGPGTAHRAVRAPGARSRQSP